MAKAYGDESQIEGLSNTPTCGDDSLDKEK
jgi:hypothetical protein